MARTRYRSWAAVCGALVVLMYSVTPGFSAEPGGIRLKGVGKYMHDQTIYLKWGESGVDLSQIVGKFPIPCSSADPIYSCIPYTEEWQPDFGEATSDPQYETQLLFLKGHGFYAYIIDLGAERFNYVLAALKTALGKPDGMQTSSVENAMGATFDQVLVGWTTTSCMVALKKRQDKDLTKGRLVVEYLPIASEAPKGKSDTPRAPF